MVREVGLEPTRPLQSSDFKSDMCYPISSLADCILVRAPGIEPGSPAPRRRSTNKLMDANVRPFWNCTRFSRLANILPLNYTRIINSVYVSFITESFLIH